MTLPRRTRLPRYTPLRTTTGLKRGKPLRTAKEKKAGRRDTGPDRSTRALVLERDDWRCACCGRVILGQLYSLQHRLARAHGGGNAPSNLITLCGSATSPGGCHLWAESREALAWQRGYWVPSWMDPRTAAVDHFVHGWIHLDDHGGWESVPNPNTCKETS